MFALKDILARLPVPGLKEAHDRQLIAESIEKVCGVPITTNKIIFKDNIVTVSVPPVIKSAIGLHKTKIITLAKQEGVQVNDIR